MIMDVIVYEDVYKCVSMKIGVPVKRYIYVYYHIMVYNL